MQKESQAPQVYATLVMKCPYSDDGFRSGPSSRSLSLTMCQSWSWPKRVPVEMVEQVHYNGALSKH